MNIKAAIFDLDGVICDTAKYHYLAWRELAQQLGFEFTLEHNERLKGVSRMQSLEILLSIGGIVCTNKEKLEMANDKNERYRSFILKMEPEEILPGVVGFLEELRSAGIKIALGSASKNAMTILERLKITHLFDVIVDGTMVEQAKPAPDVFLAGAEKLGVMPWQCVVFEDAAAGIEAALNAGMIAIGVGNKSILKRAQAVIAGFNNFSMVDMYQLLFKASETYHPN